ncbi:hypothetical protein FC093_06270 [Ilyomonas limi]|uniref:Uncharacterized protein n=1 Tax=Ilyomonas limi TaxID=2575867 RepID=A0A4U3L5A9_9BACT|nr:hypothetical protein [Ilyomonas limi]TKK70348.1 hypothetical protein FC093_06270 [Ilyomonas limi]
MMELDDLKKMWQQTPVKNINTDIMKILQQKSYGPVAALKKTFRRQMVLMFLIPLMLFTTNLHDIHGVLTSILFWSYVVFCIAIIVFAYYNYRIASKMEGMDAMIKTNLEQQVQLLEKRAKWEVAGMRGILLFFILLVEVVPYVQHYRMLDKWHSLPVAIRFGAYAMLLLLQYFLNKEIKQRKVGRHLTYLKELIKEMQLLC